MSECSEDIHGCSLSKAIIRKDCTPNTFVSEHSNIEYVIHHRVFIFAQYPGDDYMKMLNPI